MSSIGSVTHLLRLLQSGDRDAVQPLWEGFCRRLAGLARKHLHGAPCRAADEEDVALSAFDSFCRGVEQGRFPRLRDRTDLWRLLMKITTRKAQRLQKHERCQKRGGGRVLAEADLAEDGEAGEVLAQALDREPSPEFVALALEQLRHLLDRLDDLDLRSIVQWKLAGCSNDDIAGRLGCVPRTVIRRLELIRTMWDPENQP
jgi:DNA-directed RNA polymerase specialized sigma24 family protein